jgi:uroporphyrinogen decarboxylase
MFLEALSCKNQKRPPVWLMRQAGRYLPSYRKLREKHSLKELFFTPELAADITLMPVEQLGVDAAILFSDITVTALMLGFTLEFSEGPIIQGNYKKTSIHILDPIKKTIELIKKRTKVPLIGFVGAPFTVSSYINQDLSLLDAITDVTIEYIQMQQEAGVDAIQIFDSWANDLCSEDFKRYCLPYLKRLKSACKVPVILFMRQASMRLDELLEVNPAAISFDSEVSLKDIRKKTSICLQGNVDPSVLYLSNEEIRQKTQSLLESMRNDPGFIVNLSHGCRPDFKVEAVKTLIDTVKSFS